ncbi:ornithine carbamoyltransferase [Candidatus Epulonipiscioides saccharophilum]|nr:ornithine carbamoyltransferase [Epulopiscium sp. SCG-B10WGA-EpuloB]
MKNLFKLLDLTKEEIIDILDLADQLKYERKHSIYSNPLQGKNIGMIFEKASTRTRVSFEVGIGELGARPLFLSSTDLQIGRGEPLIDTARVLGRYLDAIMIRTFDQSTVEDLAKYSKVPVINGLTDFAHPCQVLADLMTIREFKVSFDDLTLCYIGDGNNMCNSLIVGALKVGMNVSIATPKEYEPHVDVLEFTKLYPGKFSLVHDPDKAITSADIIVTDVWTSMGQESEKLKRELAFKDYCLTSNLLKLANPNYIVLHCLPAHRGEEITDEVFENNAEFIFEEAENRLHVQKAVMLKLLK